MGNKIPLSAIDPFTFFSLFMKYGVEKRRDLFTRLMDETGIQADTPSDFDGVPSAQAMKVWLFPSVDKRSSGMINTLWKTFQHAQNHTLDNELFADALAVPNTGYTKLTQCLFYTSPAHYFPIDAQTRPWLKQNNISLPADTSFTEYQRCLKDVKENVGLPFYELSHLAWKSNQGIAFSAVLAAEYLDGRFPGTRGTTAHIEAFRCPDGRYLAFDPGKDPDKKKNIALFIDRLPEDLSELGKVTNYPPEKSRNSNLKKQAPSLAAGHQAWSVVIDSIEKLESLCDWYCGEDVFVSSGNKIREDSMIDQPLNQILYGPPGTGKTYATTELAVKIVDPTAYQALSGETDKDKKRAAIKERYDELVEMKRIGFTTFHQSFSYEDFIEGIRATTDDKTGALTYPVVDGVFKEMVINSSKSTGGGKSLGLSESPRVWKISIDTRGPSIVRDYCFEEGEARIGWRLTGDLGLTYDERGEEEQDYWDGLSATNQNTVEAFSEDMAIGDVLLCLKDKSTVQAVGVVTSDYFYDKEQFENSEHNFPHGRKVNWLHTDIDLNVLAINDNKRLVQKTVYQLDRISWDDILGLLKESGYPLTVESGEKPNYVMIIDEINRGNIARIFGELITLLEPSKRIGANDARKAILPYSKTPFSVPPNLYVIGTMNTADKSLAQLDLALRRRFSFIELPPLPNLLSKLEIHGVNIGELLDIINQRIDVLLDRDHLIGHSYFYNLLSITENQGRETELARVFSENIIPLLKEYFFDDFERIAWVLNDNTKSPENRFIQQGKGRSITELFGGEIAEQLTDRRYHINDSAFTSPAAYQGVVGKGLTPIDGDDGAL